MIPRTLPLCLILATALGGLVWLGRGTSPRGAEALSSVREGVRPLDLVSGPREGPPSRPSELARGHRESRREVREAGPAASSVRPAGESAGRDELSAESPAPPGPGEFDGEFVIVRYDSGGPLFEAEQSLNDSGVWVVDGRWTSYHENGAVQESGAYTMGEESGNWTWYEADGGLIASGSFVDGRREGAWTFWYANGVKQMEGHYAKGSGTGNWSSYYSNGSPLASGQFVAGEISGAWTVWDEFGEVNPERSGFYEHGERVSD